MQNQFIALVVAAVALVLFTVSCSAPSPTEPVLGEVKPLNVGDVEGTLAYWTDDATVKLVGVPPDVPDSYKGKEQVRAWFKELVASHFQIQVEVQKVEGDTVTTKTLSWQDMTRQMNIAPLIATEVYIVKNGKIASLTWTITPESLAKLQAAMGSAQPQTMTVTFAEDKCTMNGPKKVPAGSLAIDWNVVDKNHALFGLCVITVDAGKTIDDLNSVPGYPQPSWVEVVSCWDGAPGSRKTVSTGVKQSPIYLVCFNSPTTKIGALGPIEVVGK